MIRYRSRRPPDAELRARLHELANQRSRFGYRRLYILLRDEGDPSGINRMYRLYREEGLARVSVRLLACAAQWSRRGGACHAGEARAFAAASRMVARPSLGQPDTLKPLRS